MRGVGAADEAAVEGDGLRSYGFAAVSLRSSSELVGSRCLTALRMRDALVAAEARVGRG